jgi:membrane protein YdbS with pleckstrin-like domain
MKGKTFLEYYLLRKVADKSVQSAQSGNFRNWWITKIIVFIGTIIGYIIFTSVCIDVILHDYHWYWKLICIIVLLAIVKIIYEGVKKNYLNWKSKIN